VGQAVVHFEVAGKDGEALQRYYAELFDWDIDERRRRRHRRRDLERPRGLRRSRHLLRRGARRRGGAREGGEHGRDAHDGPDDVMEGLTIGLFTDPEGHVIGVMTGRGSGT
jgi:uncharacterized protein